MPATPHPGRILRDEVAAYLDTLDLSQTLEIRKAALPPKETTKPTASVYAGPVRREPLTRKTWSLEAIVYIGLQQAAPPGGDELQYVDEMLDLSEEILAALEDADFSATLAELDDTEDRDQYNALQLRESRKFTRLISLRFAVR